ncbi:MAG: adenylosuccinate synthase [Oscillospiraceae bacterium]|jgi:adenylosuccinate synthase|nr:adenylosuccinate synthase [Oscillospiraceae bacterium]
MNGTAVVGAQWGDEGKGKIIDYFAGQADVVVRSQGGNNAGHTVVHNAETYKLHLMPSGILYSGTHCLIGAGVVLDPRDLCGEINGLKARGVSVDNLRIDYRAHIVTPFHTEIDKLSELSKGESKIGTTGRGIGPCYVDKYDRIGIRFYDLIHPEIFKEKLHLLANAKNAVITKIYGGIPLDAEKIIAEYTEYAAQLAEYADDVSVLTYNSLKSDKKVLFEGAQAALLDIDFGTYPYVTSSHPLSAGSALGAGVGPNALSTIVGVAKAYTTRVGMGPFPTELDNEQGDIIRKNGAEFGTTTGRPRRTGYFDAVIVRYATRVNGITHLAINKLDVLKNTGDLKICTAYKTDNGAIIHDFPADIAELAKCSPVYEIFDGFKEDIGNAKVFSDLPDTCQKYLTRIGELCGAPVKYIGNGAARDKLIIN